MNISKTIKRTLLKTLSLLYIALSLISCEIGLGESVDINAPVVKVASPDRTGYIKQDFTITGHAEDDTGVSLMTVEIEPLDNPTPATTLKFRVQNKAWQKYNILTSEWEAYTVGSTLVTGSEKSFDWILYISLDASVASGTEFTLTTRVYDLYSNESKDSKDERSITVDMEEPAVSLIAPVIQPSYAAEKTRADNKYKLKDNSILSYLYNGELKISGSQKEDCRLDYLYVYIDEVQDSDVSNSRLGEVSKKRVDGDNLRNWSTTVDLSKIASVGDEKKVLRLVTESHDRAGNIETKVQGWFTYWNQADRPWINANFGGAEYSDNVSVYPNCALQGQAYDDDGLKEIVITVYKVNDLNEEVFVKKETFDLAGENYPTYKAWSVNALAENCKFKIVVSCKDKNGLESEEVVRKMTVTDTNPPSIHIDTDTTVGMFGDASGNVTLSGYVTDDGGINSLKLVRIRTDAPSDELINYYNDQYSEWDKATTAGTVDSNGNKVWNIKLTNLGRQTSGEHNGLFKSTFSTKFNIFGGTVDGVTGFGINGTTEKLKTQTFIILASDGKCSNIDSFTWAGDKESPELSITGLTVKTSTGTVKETIDFVKCNAQKLPKKLQPYNKDGSTITDKIILSGEWSDDSTDKWTDKSKKGPITISWEGVTDPITITTNGKYWTSSEIIPPDSTTAIISMQFNDYAGNIAKANENFFVSSNKPQLLRISAEENDGSYKAGKKIRIVLEFNKAVTFRDGSSYPTLTLNVPVAGTSTMRTASFVSGNGTIAHVFEYEIQAGDAAFDAVINAKNEKAKVLDVTAINTYGHKWYDGDNFAVEKMTLPSIVNRLAATRSLKIDTVAPSITSISAISPDGDYNATKEIFMQVTFDEDVDISDLTKFKLQLNAKENGLYTTSAVKTSSKTVLFTYKVSAGENANPLDVKALVIAGAGIADIAGNLYVAPAVLPSRSDFTNIVVDTVQPQVPVITGVSDGDYIYGNSGATVTISNKKDGAQLMYSVDGGKSWGEYSSPIVLTNNGEYTISAYQKDKAGNESAKSSQIVIHIDSGSILTSITSKDPSGVYTTGHTIPIYLNFRKPVSVTGGSITLNLSNGRTATYNSTATIKDDNGSTEKAQFDYTIQDGDNIDVLNVESITGTFKDAEGNDVGQYITSIPSGKNLADTRTIQIITTKPTITACNLVEVKDASGNVTSPYFELTFNKDVSKGKSKNITFEIPQESYKAPAILSVEKYESLLSSIPTLGNFYKLGTNGSTSACVADLDEKYILDFSKSVADVKTLFINAEQNKVIVPVNSTNVVIDPSDKKKVRVNLTGSYVLPVKGATYNVSIDSGFVIDNQGNLSAENKEYTVKPSGVEAPVIRIKKRNEKITKIGDNYVVAQPTTASVLMDCQTPGSSINYKVTNTSNSYSEVNGSIRNIVVSVAKPSPTSISDLKSSDNNKRTVYQNAAFTIGNTSTDTANLFKGYVYLISAIATANNEWSEVKYESAFRTAVQFNKNYDYNEEHTKFNPFWVRGGDATYGDVSAPNFPVSWNNQELDKVRAMTQVGDKVWYWITWSIDTTAYVGFLNGNFDSKSVTDNDGNGGKGPVEWCWGDCGIVPYKDKYPLPPGGALYFYANTDWGTWKYQNQDKKLEYRDSNDVVHKGKKP